MLKGGLISIREALDSLKPMEKKTAQYILDHPEEAVKLSVQRLALLAGVSEATIVRLSKSLNCKGFQELKLRIAADLSQSRHETDAYQEILIEGSASDLIQSVSNNNMVSIQDTLTVLSSVDVERAIDAFTNSRKICVFGVGASAIIADDFKQKLTRINRWCEAGFSFDIQAALASNMQPGDVAFGISYSGQTEDIIRSLSIAKEAGAYVISLTKFGNNPLVELSDLQLYTSSLEKSIRSGAMASRIAQLNVIDILYVGLAGRDADASIQALENTRQAVRVSKRNG